jgi:hypothetical protein
MLKYSRLDKDQQALIDRLYDFDETLVYATMGSGKTVCYLTAIDELLRKNIINRVLIIAPLKPAQHVWSCEHENWVHLQHLDVGVAIGTPAQRKAVIESNAQIVVINIENLVWFLDTYKHKHGFDAFCIDEISKFGDSGSKGVKKLRTYAKGFKHRVGLTGTPVHEGFERLFSQVMLLDDGLRFGKNKKNFLRKYFYPTDYNEYNWELIAGSERVIMDKIKTLVHAMPDYTHALPPLNEYFTPVKMPDECMESYIQLSKDFILPTEKGEIIAENEAVLSGKLEQLANGFLYYDTDNAVDFSDFKVTFTRAYITPIIKSGKQMLMFYQFKHDKHRLCKMLDSINASYTTLDSKTGLQDFLSGKFTLLLLHPKSAGHGLNLQVGGCRDIICFNPIWSNDQLKQLIGRLWRRGVSGEVNVHTFVTQGTVDEVKCARVEDKDEYDALFKAHVNSL